ncbi:7971_t:CDS:2 [Entrophospora sp. SA101]|nr:1448_t:CDS:2 [Entrophospora sp. SA101]CAJ0886811.1 7971_t:CDS:2 [Entrophospora sp. SA101]CAJ0905336.1 13347_t:CDS:2 [Entrophospora sp. SA101]
MSIQNHNPFYKLLEGESQKLLDTRYKDFIGVKSDLERIDFKQNEKFFKNLTRKLEKKKLNNVILLQPECCNNLKTLMRFVSDTFLDNASERQLLKDQTLDGDDNDNESDHTIEEEEEHEKTNHVTYMDIDTDETNTSKDEEMAFSVKNVNDFNTMMLWYKSIYQPENFENLQHYTINPLHEIYYHKGDSILKSAFSQTPRQIITAALGLPTCYLDCNCCPVDSSNAIHNNNSFMANNNNNACDVVDDKVKLDPREQILTTQNDICILYKLYLQLRFIKAFKELKLLGIISTAAKKKDHVKRLLWGTY